MPRRDRRGDGPSRRGRLGGAGAAVDIAEPGIAQTAAGRQERHRLEQVRLAGAVRPAQHDRARRRDRALPSGNCGNRSGQAGSTATRPPRLAKPRFLLSGGRPVAAASMLPIWCETPKFPAIPRQFAGSERIPAVTRASASARKARWRHWPPGRRRTGSSGSRHRPSSSRTYSPPIWSVMSSR